ncbi:MAG TPA: ATP-binding protein [Polyangiales bacterium]
MARQTPESIRLHLASPEPVQATGFAALKPEEIVSVLSSVPGTVLVVNRQRVVQACSGQGQTERNLGRDLLDLVPEGHRSFYDQQLKRVLDGGEVVMFDVEDGSHGTGARWLRVRLSPLAVEDDIRGAVMLSVDIEHERAIERRADRIRATFDHVDEGMLVVDLDTGNVIECNEAATRLLQIPIEELTDTAPSWLQVAPEGTPRLGWGALLDELCEGRAVRGMAILRDGQEVSIELRAAARKLDDGNFAFVLCRDISRDLEQERARATQERLATVGSLAAGVAHEINNPLAYVIANVQYALESITQWQTELVASTNDELDRKRALLKEALLEANEGARRVQRIVADLKTLARQGDDRSEYVDVERTLQWAIGVTMAEIRHRARLVRNFDALPDVRGDEARLGQVFVNILLNAAQAIDPGRAADNEIVVNAFVREGRVVVEVLDTGPGIPNDLLTKIFDPFFTTKPRGVGTGLGLSICHEIVASMRGTLTGGNRGAGGARFVVELPAASHSQIPAGGAVKRLGKSQSPPQQRAKVLIIDDETLAAKALGRILREHQVEIAEHATSGLSLALQQDYDIIFCDLMMPDLSGMAVFAEVERKRPTAASRMVFITGGTFTEEARNFATRHAERCLFKPFDSTLVKEAVSRVMERSA